MSTDHTCGRREAVDEHGEQRRAAEQARDGDRVEETQSLAEEAEGEKWRRKRWEQGRTRKEDSNTLRVIFHFASATTPHNTRNSSSSGSGSNSNRSSALAVTR